MSPTAPANPAASYLADAASEGVENFGLDAHLTALAYQSPGLRAVFPPF